MAGDAGHDVGSATSWRTLVAETASAVGDRQHARWMCETASGLDGVEFLSALDQPATERAVAHLDSMIERARNGEPIQYVLGRWAFRRIELAIDGRVLIPRPETELVAEIAIDLAASVPDDRVVVDLGTGSGAIGLALADELPVHGTTVWLTDVDSAALDVARANLAGLGRPATNVRIAPGVWFEALPDDVVADVVVSNPPYVADNSPEIADAVRRWEPSTALYAGPDGLSDLRAIIAGAPSSLRVGGWLVLEIGSDQGPAVRDLLVAGGFVDVDVHRDHAGHERVAVGRLRARRTE